MSLRSRLLLALGAVALVALLAADLVGYQQLRTFLYRRVDQSLESDHVPIEQRLESLRPEPPASVSPGTYVAVLAADGSVLVAQGGEYRENQLVGPRLPAKITGLRSNGSGGEPTAYFTAGPNRAGGPRFRVRVSVLNGGDVLVLAQPLDATVATLHRLALVDAGVAALTLLVALLAGWWLVRMGLRPLADVEATANAIAEGDLDRRVAGDDKPTEVGRLARAFNSMLGRIQDAFAQRDATETELRRSEERLRRFLADASHELRTPLAAVAAYAELFERGAQERPEDLARVMTGIRSETSRMGLLVEDLLLLARLDEGRPLEREPLDLVSLAAQAVQSARAVGPAWPVLLEAREPVEVSGDPARLRQVVDNLLANVRAHTPPGTSSTVTVGRDGAAVVLSVVDHGPGLTPEQAERVFERFFRVDPSRSRKHGGAGLGLSIVAAIVAAHGGTVEVEPTPGGGATFRVRLPASGVTAAPEEAPPAAAAG